MEPKAHPTSCRALSRAPRAARRAGAVILALTLAAAAGAQDPRPEPVPPVPTEPTERPAFAERIEVRVVNLEAVVVDREGQRVSGLGPADFLLRVDGKEVPIEYFAEIADGRAIERAEAPPAPAPSRDAAAPAPAGVAPGEPVGTSYLVFVDQYFTTIARDRNRVLESIRTGLWRLGPEDRMAIVAFDGRELEMLANWTREPDRLGRALEDAMRRPARGLITSSPVREIDAGDPAAEAPGEDEDDQFSPEGRTAQVPPEFCAQLRRLEHRTRRAAFGVAAALRGFARPPGRKVMVLLSGGWPQSAKDYLSGGLESTATGHCASEGVRIWRPVYETANLLGYTLYPVDVRGPESPFPGAERRLLDEEFDPRGQAMVRQAETQGTLLRLAAETGGEATLGAAAFSAFDRVVDDTRTYYWLGFTPKWKGDDREHRVELSVRRPGLRVRARSGFTDLSRTAEVSFATESALLFGGAPGARPLGLRLGRAKAKGKGLLLPLEVLIPMDEVTMVPEGRRYVARLELRVAVLDRQGNRNEMPVVPVVLEGAGPPPPGSHSVYETSVRVREERHQIAVTVFDPVSDRLLVGSATFRP